MLYILNNIKPMITDELKNATPEELCLIYQKTHSDSCVATMYEKMFGMLVKIKHHFPLIDDETAGIAALETLVKAMDDFDVGRGNHFSTVCHTNYYRRLYMETKPLTRAKRNPKFLSDAISLNDTISLKGNSHSNFAEVVGSHPYWIDRDIVFLESVNKIDFTDEQKTVYTYLINGYSRKETADKMHMTVSKVVCVIKQIRELFITNNLYSPTT